MHDIEPNDIGLILAPFLHRSNRHSLVSHNVSIMRCDSLSSTGCIKIQPIPSALQSAFNHVGLSRSNLVSNGEEVTATFSPWNKVTSSGVHEMMAIGF